MEVIFVCMSMYQSFVLKLGGWHSRTVKTPVSCFNADEEAIKEENGLAMHYHDNMQGRSLRQRHCRWAIIPESSDWMEKYSDFSPHCPTILQSCVSIYSSIFVVRVFITPLCHSYFHQPLSCGSLLMISVLGSCFGTVTGCHGSDTMKGPVVD